MMIEMKTKLIRPSRRAFIGTMLACVASPAMPKFTLPEMQFHSVAIGGDIAELFWRGYDDDRSWEIVPAYNREQAVQLMITKARRWVAESGSTWSPESEWEIGVTDTVSEADVIESSKLWGLGPETTAMRLMQWSCDGDDACEHCGLYSLDDLVPTCNECYLCKFCADAGTERCFDCPWEAQ
jgi:hypothetical protein